MPFPIVPILIAGGLLLFAATQKPRPSSASGGGQSGGTPGGGTPSGGTPSGTPGSGSSGSTTDPPGGVEDTFVACGLEGLPLTLRNQVAAALANPSVLGVPGLVALAAEVAKSGAAGPIAAACISAAAAKLKQPSNTPPFLPAIFTGKVPPLLGGGSSPVPGPTPAPGGGGSAPSPGTAPSPFPGFPAISLADVPSWCTTELCGVNSSKKPPFATPGPGEHGHFAIRAGDFPATLALYYVGDSLRAKELAPYNGVSSNGHPMVSATGVNLAGWKAGEAVIIPASWQPYSKPLPMPGTTTPMPHDPISGLDHYPNLPSVPPIPGVDTIPSGFPFPGF